MLHRGHRTWTPYVDPHPEKENSLPSLPLKTPVRLGGGGKHHTLNHKLAPSTGNAKASGSQTVKGKEKDAGAEGKQRLTMTVGKDRNLVLTGKKNGVSVRGQEGTPGESDTFGIKKLEFKPAPAATLKPKSKLSQQVSIPSPADDGFSALPQQHTPPMAKMHERSSLGGVESTPLPSATRSRRRSRASFTPLRPSPNTADAQQMATPLPALNNSGPSSFRFPASTSHSNMLDKSFITPARPSYRAYLSPPEYGDGEDGDTSGRDESFEMGDVRMRMGGLGVVDENEGEVGVDGDVDARQMDAELESDGEVEYMPPKVVPLPDVIPFDFVPLKTLGQQLNQIKSDLFIAESDSDEDAYPYVERQWNPDLGKEELLVGGWEGDEDVRPLGRGVEKRLEMRLGEEFNNPVFANLKINQARMTKAKPLSSMTQMRRPVVGTARRPLQQTRPGSATTSGQQRAPTGMRRPVSSSLAKPTLPIVTRPMSGPSQARQRPAPITSTTRVPTAVRPAVTDSAKQRPTFQRPTTTRPVLGQARPNAKLPRVAEPLLKCEDVGFDL